MSGSVITPSISEPQTPGDVSLGLVTRLLDTLDKSLLVAERSGRILMVNSRARKCLDSLQLGDLNRLNLFGDLLEVDAKRIFTDIESGQHEVKLDLSRGEKRTRASIHWVPEPDWLVVEFEESGLRQIKFCPNHGLALSTLQRQLKRRLLDKSEANESSRLVARSDRDGKGRPVCALEVVLSSGQRMEVRPDFDSDTLELERLVSVWRECRPCLDWDRRPTGKSQRDQINGSGSPSGSCRR